MKPRILWLVAAFFLTSLFSLTHSEAGVLDDLMAYNQGNTQTYTYTATDAVQPPYNGAMQYGGGTAAYPAAPAPQRRPMVAQQTPAPQAPLPQAQPYAQPQPKRKAVAKKKPVQHNPAAKAQAPKQAPQRLAATQYQQTYPAQARPAARQTYYQTPQTGYYGNPYQNQYRAAPNYYQGYSYGGWGSSGQACPPGRA